MQVLDLAGGQKLYIKRRKDVISFCVARGKERLGPVVDVPPKAWMRFESGLQMTEGALSMFMGADAVTITVRGNPMGSVGIEKLITAAQAEAKEIPGDPYRLAGPIDLT